MCLSALTANGISFTSVQVPYTAHHSPSFALSSNHTYLPSVPPNPQVGFLLHSNTSSVKTAHLHVLFTASQEPKRVPGTQ